MKQLTSKIVAIPRVDPGDCGCVASSGSIVVQREGNAMSSGIDVNRMPKPIMEICSWQKSSTKSEKELPETTEFFKPSFAFNL